MSTELPELSLTAIARSKTAAALTKYQLELAQEVCLKEFKTHGDHQLVAQIASVIAANYSSIIAAKK
ncbi:hypothetical protein WCQ02_34870 [Paraburkholderia tropica]|uniref:hypothetical protein n=1 Tax=Paraburkholderia tropica TaxID=92647 RepID=UPI003019DEBE